MPTLRVLSDRPQKRQVQSAAAWREFGSDHPGHGGQQNQTLTVQSAAGDTPLEPDAGSPPAQAPGTLTGESGESSAVQPGEIYDPVAAQLSQVPHYDFEALLAWLAQGAGHGESLDPEEIRRRWARVAAANYYAPQDEATRGAALGWHRLSGALGAANGAGSSGTGQFTGVGLTSGLPQLESFKGLNEGLQRL